MRLICQILKHCFLLVLVGLSCGVSSQDPYFKLFTSEDGLPSNQIYEIFQDSKGIMWFGTNNGAVRYDGCEMEIFNIDNGLRAPLVSRIREDKDGKINIMNRICASRYEDGTTKPMSFQVIEMISEKVAKSQFPRLQFARFGSDSLDWILNQKGYYRIKNNELHAISPPDNRPYLTISEKKLLFHIGEKHLWVPHDFSQSEGNNDFDYLKINDQLYFLYYGNQLFVYENDQVRLLRKFDSQISCLAKSAFYNGSLLVSTYSHGIHRFDLAKLTEYPQVLFPNIHITATFEDHEGGLWVGSNQIGLLYIPNQTVQTYTLEKNGIQQEPLFMVGHKDSIFFATNNGELYGLQNNTMNRIAAYDEQIKCLTMDRNNQLVVAVDKHGIIRVPNNELLHKYNETPRIKMHFTLENELCFSYDEAGILYKDETPSFHGKTRSIYALAEKDSHSLYVGTYDGLYEFDLRDKKFNPLFPQSPLYRELIHDVQTTKDFIVLSASNGLSIVNQDTFFYLQKLEGLSTSFTPNTHIDRDETLWITTAKGLNRVDNPFDKEKRNIRVYSIQSGLPTNKINNTYTYKDTVWVATGLGISKFLKPDTIIGAQPVLNLNKVSINNQPFPKKATYELAYKQNVIRIDFKGLTYRKRNSIRYQYRLLGTDSIWTTSKEHFVLFSGLGSGDYTLEIKAIGLFGESSPTQRVHFHIGKPFWATWWFWAAIGGCLLSIVWLLFQRRLNRIKSHLEGIQLRQRLTDELNTITHQSLSSQLNPHFIFNALNSIQRFVLENDRKSSNKYLSRFAQLMRLVLENSKEPFISLDLELRTLEAYLDLETLRLKEKVSYSIEVDSTLAPLELKIPPLLLQPMVENAIWHGLMVKNGQGCIKVKISNMEEQFCCIIEDDGIGRKKLAKQSMKVIKEQRSSGTAMTEKRISIASQLYNKEVGFQIIDLKDDVGNGIGTRVEIALPKVY